MIFGPICRVGSSGSGVLILGSAKACIRSILRSDELAYLRINGRRSSVRIWHNGALSVAICPLEAGGNYAIWRETSVRGLGRGDRLVNATIITVLGALLDSERRF